MTPKQHLYLTRLLKRHKQRGGIYMDTVVLASTYRDWLTPSTLQLWDSSTGETRGRFAAWIVSEAANLINRVAAMADNGRLTPGTASLWIGQLSGDNVLSGGVLHLQTPVAERFGLGDLLKPAGTHTEVRP